MSAMGGGVNRVGVEMVLQKMFGVSGFDWVTREGAHVNTAGDEEVLQRGGRCYM